MKDILVGILKDSLPRSGDRNLKKQIIDLIRDQKVWGTKYLRHCSRSLSTRLSIAQIAIYYSVPGIYYFIYKIQNELNIRTRHSIF